MRAIEARLRSYLSGAVPAALVLLVVLATSTARAQTPAGGEFQVNTYLAGDQVNGFVARQPDGKLIVVWSSANQDGSSSGVYAQLFDASAAPVGGEFRVNTYTTGGQIGPTAAAAGGGEFVVAWVSGAQDGSGNGVFAQRVGPTGVLLGPEFRANTYTLGNQSSARVAASSAAGNFVVVWDSAGQDGQLNGIFGQCFTAVGNPSGAEFQVNSYTTQYQYLPDVAMNETGAFVVAWMDHPRRHSYAQRYASNCTRAGTEFQANSGLTPSVAIDAAGGFVVAASALGIDGNSYAILAQRYAPDGTPQGAVVVNTYTTGFQEWPAVRMDAAGGFVVAWDTYSIAPPFGVRSVSARAFRANGAPTGPELTVNTYTTSLQTRTGLGVDDEGNFVVSWTGSDGIGTGVKAQRFLAPADVIFADGFNSGNLGAWSSSSTDGGDLSVTGTAGLVSTPFGLEALVDDTAGLYVQDDSPGDENRYHARFYFDPNGFDPGVSQSHLRTRVFIGFQEAPTRRLFAVVLRRQAGGQYSLMGRVRRDDNAQVDTGFFPISDGPHFVEVDWKQSSGPDANDGTFQMWIDDASVAMLTGLDDSASAIDFVRMGALSVKDGAAGTLYYDEFESHRRTDIGPVP